MEAIDLQAVIESKNPTFFERMPSIISKGFLKILRSILHIEDINEFIVGNKDKRGMEFIDEIFEHFEFSYLLSARDHKRIPAEGKLICVANHPLGALDGLVLLKAIGEVRPDVKIVVNDVLLQVTNLNELFLPYDIFSTRSQKHNIINIKNALMNEEAVIFFPSAEVSRLGTKGVRDGKWFNGAAYFARKLEVPVLPIYVKGRNSMMFYLTSLIHKNFSTFLLPREIFLKRLGYLRLKIGDPIPGFAFKNDLMNLTTLSKLMRAHVYSIGKRRKGILKTEKNIIHPVEAKIMKKELSEALLLDTPSPGKKTYLINYQTGKNVLREIARLREVTFRRVGEGTGRKMDGDHYDRYYEHLVLWDEEELEIMGSYRLGLCKDILDDRSRDALYTSSLFNYTAAFTPYLEHSIELGRSFIQYKYWKSNALHYLWKGIGALLKSRPDVKYLFGAVSISDTYPEIAKQLIYYYYTKWNNSDQLLATAKTPFALSQDAENEVSQILNGKNADEDFRTLKKVLKIYGFAVPILFKQYTQLVDPGGAVFLDFCVDTSFKTVDGLVMLDIDMIKQSKKKTYGLIEKEKK